MTIPPSQPRTWKAALMALVTPRDVSSSLAARQAEREAASKDASEPDDEREPFHLDDTETPKRFLRERGLVQYRTPPHARLVFPTLTGQ